MKRITFILICLFLVVFCFSIATALAIPSPEEQRQSFIECAQSFLGVPYKYGGLTEEGFDCSGFIYTVAKNSLHISLPRRSEDLYLKTEPVSDEERQPGDILFFKANTHINHAAIYLGDDQIIHAVSDGPKTGVIISSIHEDYWERTYVSTRRFLPRISENLIKISDNNVTTE